MHYVNHNAAFRHFQRLEAEVILHSRFVNFFIRSIETKAIPVLGDWLLRTLIVQTYASPIAFIF